LDAYVARQYLIISVAVAISIFLTAGNIYLLQTADRNFVRQSL
jgi:hypothetical protein